MAQNETEYKTETVSDVLLFVVFYFYKYRIEKLPVRFVSRIDSVWQIDWNQFFPSLVATIMVAKRRIAGGLVLDEGNFM